MKHNIVFVLFFSISVSFAQSVESISIKLSDKICECMSTSETNSSIKMIYNYCEERVLNKKETILNTEELEFLKDEQHISSLKRGLFLKVNQTCTYLQQLLNPNTPQSNTSNSFPISFEKEKYAKIENYDKQLVTVEGTIKEVITHKGYPYFQIETGDQIIVANSAFVSGFENSGTLVKIMGYVAEIKPTKFLKKLQKGQRYQINVYGIVNMKTMDFAYFPGTEQKMSQWRNGTIPN